MSWKPRAQYITDEMIGKTSFDFGAEAMDPAAPSPSMAYCERCVKSIAMGRRCGQRGTDTCGYCSKNKQGDCTALPHEFNGRITALLRMQADNEAALARADSLGRDPATSNTVIATGTRLSRAQREFNRQLAATKRAMKRTGASFGVPKEAPVTTQDWERLKLFELRRNAEATETMAAACQSIVNYLVQLGRAEQPQVLFDVVAPRPLGGLAGRLFAQADRTFVAPDDADYLPGDSDADASPSPEEVPASTRRNRGNAGGTSSGTPTTRAAPALRNRPDTPKSVAATPKGLAVSRTRAAGSPALPIRNQSSNTDKGKGRLAALPAPSTPQAQTGGKRRAADDLAGPSSQRQRTDNTRSVKPSGPVTRSQSRSLSPEFRGFGADDSDQSGPIDDDALNRP